ncbi:hypothetical protein ACP4OV_019392 [Aristida adscensionis]
MKSCNGEMDYVQRLSMVHYILDRQFPAEMDYAQRRCFIIAVVIFASSFLFCPNGRAPRAKPELVHSLVVYLDNLDFGESSTVQFRCPRIRDFGTALLEKLSELDLQQCGRGLETVFGKREIRHPTESIYSLGQNFIDLLERNTSKRRGNVKREDGTELIELLNHFKEEEKKMIRKNITEFSEKLCDKVVRYHDGMVSAAER